ncbi:hypothetical protein HID58_087151 [Brassica napus]|uniref:Uncharacterized protein n=1 Tax=Brassica napus TaxID=3708 RepID=A0ABQ7XSF1_BRANA|nr:hypothetical protein HID58_087151 [Brassica napus]
MKFVVPCAVFEADFPDPPDKSMHLGSYNGSSWSWRMEKSLKTWIRVEKSLWKTF